MPIISCEFFPILRNWYVCCWIRKQPKYKSPDTWSRLLTCMNTNMQIPCPYAITQNLHTHSCTTDLVHAQQPTAWHVFTFQPLSTCARTSGRWGPADALPVSTGRGADEQRAHSHLGICLFCYSPWVLRGLLRVTNSFCFLFWGFYGTNGFAWVPFFPEPWLCAVRDELWGILSLESCSPFLHAIRALWYLIYLPLVHVSGESI